jgi:large subunit ribosomal protein L25
MVETLVIKAERRDRSGTRSARKLREAGLVPGIIYGHQEESVAVHMSYHDLALELHHHHKLLTVELDGKTTQLLVKELQYDHLGDKVIHVDLTRVSLDERVPVTVRIVLRGTPAGAAEGGVLEQLMGELELECLVTSIPEEIRVPVHHLQLDQTLTVGEIELPEGATLLTESDMPVALVKVLAEEEEELEEGAAEGEAEPEVITKKPSEEESEGGSAS